MPQQWMDNGFNSYSTLVTNFPDIRPLCNFFFYVFDVAPFWHIKLHGHSSRNIGQIEVNKKPNSFTWKMQVKMIYFCKRSSWNPRCIHRLNICDFSYLDVDLNTNFNQGHWSREVHVGQMVPTFAKVKDLH